MKLAGTHSIGELNLFSRSDFKVYFIIKFAIFSFKALCNIGNKFLIAKELLGVAAGEELNVHALGALSLVVLAQVEDQDGGD